MAITGTHVSTVLLTISMPVGNVDSFLSVAGNLCRTLPVTLTSGGAVGACRSSSTVRGGRGERGKGRRERGEKRVRWERWEEGVCQS